MKLSELWAELEAVPARPGIIRRRVRPESACDVYVGVRKPSNERLLVLGLGEADPELPQPPPGRVLSLRASVGEQGERTVELALVSAAYADLFDALVYDIVGTVTAAASAEDGAHRFVARLMRWQAFLQTAQEGLGPERQRGLYGELWVLNTVMVPAVGGDVATRSWTGPSQAPQDFNVGSVAIEVKATAGKQHQTLGIASELQLDASALSRLFLCHLSLDVREAQGQTLPELVSELRHAVRDATMGSGTLEDKLLEAGYHDIHAPLYRLGYSVRASHVFEVRDGFPAISEAAVPMGVGDVRYSIAVSACGPFAVDEGTLLHALKDALHAAS